MKSDLSKVKKGDTIYAIQIVVSEVRNINLKLEEPIHTKYQYRSYTLDGKFCASDKYPSAFTYNPLEKIEELEAKIKELEQQIREKVVSVRNTDSQDPRQMSVFDIINENSKNKND